MSRTAQTAIAFVAAPIVATVTVWVLLAVSSTAPPVGFAFTVAVIAFAVVIVLGVPAFLITRPWHLKTKASYGLVGAVVGLLPASLLALGTKDLPLALITLFSSAVAGVTFGVIAGRESNNRMERTREP